MPNWVTTHVTAPKHVIQGMLNADGLVDFSTILPFPGPHNEWNGISVSAEEGAEIVCAYPMNENPLISALQKSNRERFDIRSLDDREFSQFVGMLENYRACGYLHSMDFNRKVWGTKWNACESSTPEENEAHFETAWSCPKGVLIELSKRHPEDVINVVFADEDIGSNCGRFTLKNGEIVDQDIAPPWREMNAEVREKWSAFAHAVIGRWPYADDAEGGAA